MIEAPISQGWTTFPTFSESCIMLPPKIHTVDHAPATQAQIFLFHLYVTLSIGWLLYTSFLVKKLDNFVGFFSSNFFTSSTDSSSELLRIFIKSWAFSLFSYQAYKNWSNQAILFHLSS